MKVFGIVLAAGESNRFGGDKLAAKLGNETILGRSIRILGESCTSKDIFIVSNVVCYDTPKVNFVKLLSGGNSRFESMRIGVEEVAKGIDEDGYKDVYVLIHNAANPGVTIEEIQACLDGAIKVGACGVAHKVKDTIRRSRTDLGTRNGLFEPQDDPKSLPGQTFEVLDRSNLYAMQTPQCIRLDILLKGIELFQEIQLKNCRPSGTLFGKQANALAMTDDLQLLDLINQNSEEKVAYTLIDASETNFKITTKEDLKKMRAVLGLSSENVHKQLVGVGQDSHEFEKNQTNNGSKASDSCLILGGMKFQDLPKLKAHSDGDIILHALFNAISSALGEGSLGQTADKMCEDGVKDSREYLKIILEKMLSKGYAIGNLSISLVCKKPKIDSIENDLKKNLSKILNLPTEDIGITATSGEGLYNDNTIACTCAITLI